MKFAVATGFVIGFISLRLTAGAPARSDTGIFDSIRSGDIAGVEKLLPNAQATGTLDEHGNTLLMAAAMHADPAILELLLKSGSDVNATNPAGVTALMRAATSEKKARLLVAAGARINARSALGNTALILAARKPENHRTVQLLLERGAEVNATNTFGATALMAAAAAEDIESVRLLLDHGADINARPTMDGDGFIWAGGRTPLMWAAFKGNERLVKLLLERGATVNHFTLVGGALAQAAWGDRPGVARRLLDAGAQIDQRDLVANYTPLHWASSTEHSSPALVKLLLARGADVKAEGGQPVDNFLGATETPLSLARKRGNTPIARVLQDAGAMDSAESNMIRPPKLANRPASGSTGDPAVEAIQRALPPLVKTAEESARTFRRHASRQQCISCHQQQLPLAALSLAHARQFPTDRAAVARQLTLLNEFISSSPMSPNPQATALELTLQTTFHPEPAIVAGYASMVLQLEHEPSSPATDAMVHQLATIQNADGHWSWNLPRPPIQGSDVGATALAVHSIKHFAIPGRKRELEARLERARVWLAKAHVETTEERIHQLLGLHWAGDSSARLRKLSAALIDEQRSDGGWSQLAGLEPDAYATGQAIYALIEGGGIASTHPAIRRGVDFLLKTQWADGTWHVRRRAHPFQPPMDSGFPHGADGWISSAGSSWAVMALLTATGPSPATQAILAHTTTHGAEGSADKSGPSTNPSGDNTVPVEFARDIQPIFERSCVSCHSGERAKGGFVVTDRAALLRGGARGEPVVVPGKPDASSLIQIVQDQIEDLEMPPLAKRGKYPQLTRNEIEKLKAWASQGAPWPADATLHPSQTPHATGAH